MASSTHIPSRSALCALPSYSAGPSGVWSTTTSLLDCELGLGGRSTGVNVTLPPKKLTDLNLVGTTFSCTSMT